MHCKHCGSKIDDDSKFCQSCGGNVGQMGQPLSTQQPINLNTGADTKEIEQINIHKKKFRSQDKGLLIAFILMVGVRLFWIAWDNIIKGKSYSEIEPLVKYFLNPSYIVFWSAPICLALFSRRKEQRIILFIISVIIIGWTIYITYFKS
jgi:hypothetical protein